MKDAYFIELKGTNIDEAIRQLEDAISMLKNELQGYRILLRIVSRKVGTHKINSLVFRKAQERYGDRLICKSGIMEEFL